MSWLEEWWIVFLHSGRTQLALFLGVLFFFLILLFGDSVTESFELHGVLAPLTEVIRAKLLHRYEHAAWAALGGFLLLAVKLLKKDRKRLLGE